MKLFMIIPLALTAINISYAQTAPMDNTICIDHQGKQECKKVSPDLKIDTAPELATNVETKELNRVIVHNVYKPISNVYKYKDASGQWIYTDAPPKSIKGKSLAIEKLDFNK
jgi:hypothetical protein